MRLSTFIIIVIIVGGGLFFAWKKGYIGKAEKAVEDSFSVHLAKGKRLYNSMKYDEAITELEKAIAVAPDHPDMPRALRCLGDCYKEKRDPKKAIEIYERIVKDYPGDPMIGNVEQAIEKVKALGHF